MRKTINLDNGWMFYKDGEDPQVVTVPHTWNAVDGQDGGNDYYRGACRYERDFCVSPAPAVCYLEFDGVNSSCTVILNGVEVGRHDGGYSRFRFDVTRLLSCDGKNHLVVEVDNGVNDKVYPQTADFTFYGGIYRSVRLVCLEKQHFDMDSYGSKGLKITPSVVGSSGKVDVSAYFDGPADNSHKVRLAVKDMDGKEIVVHTEAFAHEISVSFEIEGIVLWDGLDNPYCYELSASIVGNDGIVDSVSDRFGFRTFAMDPEKGFILNGRPYPLRGVSRHQDIEGRGNALTMEDHVRDIDLIMECGANSVRLAHYQHAQEFYDLCDRKGLVVWAEIPFISKFMPEGRENTISQMKELISQNYNHPSIVCWSLSNEITAAGESVELLDNSRTLNDLCHEMDKTRPTVMAHAFMLSPKSPMVGVSDLISYNLYYGWYVGEAQENGHFLDEVHSMYPDKALALSEYGADCLVSLQTEEPEKGDMSETFQALFHERMCRLISERPYLWATYLWNMFDFGADARVIGTSQGRNCKGLVSFDRKTRKDSFYVFKAFFSKEPFVHIAGRRFKYRNSKEVTIKVYSNQKSVSLYNNGILVWTSFSDKVFEFNVELKNINRITAVSGSLSDEIVLVLTEEPQTQYRLPESSAVSNWFEGLEIKPSDEHLTIFDKVDDVVRVAGWDAMEMIMAMRDPSKAGIAAEVTIEPEMLKRLLKGYTVKQLLMQSGFEERKVVEINQMLAAYEKRT